jgi:UV DNA damage endonuclease
VTENLRCLRNTLEFNKERGLLFFRITSDLIPFASHPVCSVRWQKEFRSELASIGRFIRESTMRVSMYPDQFVLINPPHRGVWERSLADLRYHADVLDLLEVDEAAKIQIHVGGVYGDREKAWSDLRPGTNDSPQRSRRGSSWSMMEGYTMRPIVLKSAPERG